jgi:hypothetical protein
MAGIGNETNSLFSMEPPQIPSDDDIQKDAASFADIIFGNPKMSRYKEMKATFIEDFSMGAKWMRRKMREAYENHSAPQGRGGKPKASKTT